LLLAAAFDLDRLLFNLQLFCGFQITGFIRLSPKPLNRGKHIFLLRQKGIAQLLRPGQIRIHHLQNLRERSQRFDARVPWLLFQRILKSVAGNFRIFIGPACSLDHLERIGRGHQYLR
jgi:hypothetical protein